MSKQYTHKGPWQIKSTKVIYKNPWTELREDQVITPSGKDGIYGVTNLLDGVCVISIDENGMLHFVKEFKYAVNDYCIEGVCGGIEKGHTKEETAHKELAEELGITAKSLEYIGAFDTFTSVVECTMHLYIAREISLHEHAHEETEVIEPITLSLTQAYEMMLNGEINHLPTTHLINHLYIKHLESK